jgi:hypothetical protein
MGSPLLDEHIVNLVTQLELIARGGQDESAADALRHDRRSFSIAHDRIRIFAETRIAIT